MAWVTTLGPNMAQIEYRLQASGCSLERGADGQLDYRMDGADRPLEWVGQGLREVGIEPGSVLDEAGKAAARALADGVDPRTGEVLVAPKMAVDPRAKLPARPLIEAVAAAAQRADVTVPALLDDAKVAARYARAARGVTAERDGAPGSHVVPVRDLERIADAAGVDLAGVYDGDQLATAREHADDRVVIGNRGYDLTLDLPKSYSVLVGLADEQLAAQLEDVYLDAVRETVAAVEQWAGYGMAGHHGDGQRADRVATSGMLGWMTTHRTARPVPGAAPDPHLHAHVTVLNLVKCEDGKWRTVGAGGRDIHRHARAADAHLRARLREVTAARWGMAWERDERTGAWEVAAVPAELRARFSKRAGQIGEAIEHAGGDREAMSAAEQKVVAAQTREQKLAPGAGGDLRANWRRQASDAWVDIDIMVAAATPGPAAERLAQLDTDEVVAHAFRAGKGLTAHRKTATRADLLAEVMDAQPAGVRSLADAERVVDDALAHPHVVALPPAGAVHLTNCARFTSADVVDAERTVMAAAADRAGRGYATVDRDVVDMSVAQFEAGRGFTLGGEQRAVLDRLLTGGHGVDAVVGVAGAGKTTIMEAARVAFEAAGLRVAGTSTAAVAAQNLQTEAGIPSRTVASWLNNIAAGRGLDGVDVLVVDEAAMVDDRQLAQLLIAAGDRTKVVMIGDPLQLKAPGVGGAFAEVHRIIDGLTLTENRRQRDELERAALAQWRLGEREQTLRMWADSGRLHVTDTAESAHAQMVGVWQIMRQSWPDPHERIAGLLMMAHRNADVDALNVRARAALVEAGELPAGGRAYRCDDGRRITLVEGDQVLIRRNDYRRDERADVLNGYRGVVRSVLSDGRVMVEWRRDTADGPRLFREWVTADFVTSGGVTYGYAITAAKAQGLTAWVSLAYGNGMDSHVLYPAMSRDKEHARLYVALQPLETDTDRARLGPARAGDRVDRAVVAYAAALEHDRPDAMVTAELDADRVQAPDERTQTLRRLDALRGAAEADRWAAEQTVDRQLATTSAESPRVRAAELAAQAFPVSVHEMLARQQEERRAAAMTPAERAAAAERIAAGGSAGTGYRKRPHGRIRNIDAAMSAAEADAAGKLDQAIADAAAAQRAARAARAGDGPAVRQLREQREQLHTSAAAVPQLRAAADAAQQVQRQAAAADAEYYRLRGQRAQSTFQILKSGTTPSRLDERIAQAQQHAEQLRARAAEARRQADAQRQAVGAHHPDQVVRQVAEFDRDYDRKMATARANDLVTAERYGRAADRTAGVARDAVSKVDELRQEATLRQRMPAAERAAENAARLAEQVKRTQRAAAQQQQQAEQQRQYDHRRDRGIDRGGPTLGM